MSALQPALEQKATMDPTHLDGYWAYDNGHSM